MKEFFFFFLMVFCASIYFARNFPFGIVSKGNGFVGFFHIFTVAFVFSFSTPAYFIVSIFRFCAWTNRFPRDMYAYSINHKLHSFLGVRFKKSPRAAIYIYIYTH